MDPPGEIGRERIGANVAGPANATFVREASPAQAHGATDFGNSP